MSSTNTIGKYQITREIARSNDIVYEAIDPALGRRIALKELNLPPNLTGAQKRERIERFLREGKAAGQLSHPNIVTIYDVGQEGDRFYIAMEYLEGQTLREVLQMRGALPMKEAIDITLQLCQALGYAHQHNIVHRDVKPENVQILPGGHVKLTDFGIARIMSEPSITANGQVFGTPSYMSPEQVSGRQIDGRSDIFALGVMLYEMLAGGKPFSGDTVVTITYNIMNTEPTPPVGVPPYICSIIQKAMSKDANMRYRDVEEMAEALKNEPPNGGMLLGDPYAVNASPGYTPTYGGPAPTTYRPPTPGGYLGGQPSPSSPPMTPYGQSVPDPFAQAPSVPLPAAPPPIPRRPILTLETRTFLGVLFLIVGLAGLLLFAVWTVNQAYLAYADRTAAETSEKYAQQGDKLLALGKVSAAIDQYNNAIRAAGTSKTAKPVRRKVAVVYTEQARQALLNNSYSAAAQHAARAVDADSTLSAGHYYLAASSSNMGDQQKAEEEYRKAIDTGGNDDFAVAARRLLSQLYIQRGDWYARNNQFDQAKAAYQSAVDLQDPDWAPVAQARVSNPGQ